MSEQTPFEAAMHPLEAWTPRVLLRSQIDGAPYNPRVHTDKARARLKRALKKLGLLEPLVWNKRSPEKGWPADSRGCLVGGHMRLKVLDGLADGAPDFKLTVAEVDLTAAQERSANVLLNNQLAAGQDDPAKLEELFHFPGIEVDATGFEVSEVYSLFGDSVFADDKSTLDPEGAGLEAETTRLTELRNEIRERIAKKAKTKNTDDFFVLLVFRNADECTEALKAAGLTDETDPDDLGSGCQDGRLLLELVELRKEVAALRARA